MDNGDYIYVVTDIEVDGPWPGPNSMRSFASVAVTKDGHEHGVFEAVLEPLPGAQPDAQTYEWFQGQSCAWAAATDGPVPIGVAMHDFTMWVRGLPPERVFSAFPIAFDGLWLDYYLRRFTGYGLVQGPYEKDPLFVGAGLCLRSFAAALTSRPVVEVSAGSLPAEWLGNIEHTHRAIDDARGYARLLAVLMQRSDHLGNSSSGAG